MDAVHEREDEDQPRSACLSLDLPELEQHHALVLLDDPRRHRNADQRHDDEYNDHIDSDHGLSFLAVVGGARCFSRTGRMLEPERTWPPKAEANLSLIILRQPSRAVTLVPASSRVH